MTVPLVLKALPVAGLLVIGGFYAGAVPIPVGYDRGKIKWLTWCAVGMHPHICYWHGGESGLQSIHPDDLSDGGADA